MVTIFAVVGVVTTFQTDRGLCLSAVRAYRL